GARAAGEVGDEGVKGVCGDGIRMEVNVSADQTITAVRFRGDSCIISRAAASILTELIQGQMLQEVITLPQEELLTALHTTIRPARMKCALLPLNIVQAGLAIYLRSYS